MEGVEELELPFDLCESVNDREHTYHPAWCAMQDALYEGASKVHVTHLDVRVLQRQ